MEKFMWKFPVFCLCPLQAEKRKMLTEHETQKIKELEEHYSNELREWKAMLIPRKQVKYKS